MRGAVFSLSHHASYRCRHSGACCNAGWTIPVEPERRARLGVSELTQPAGRGCRFYDGDSRLCTVQRDHGVSAMPASCQHFPRRALVDSRGTFVTLSHYCPTAAAMLFEAAGPLAIVANPPGFPSGHDWDGLDATGEWPPLLNPGVMFDLDAYSAFERFVVDTLAREVRIHTALETIAAAVEGLRGWNQRRGSFLGWAEEIFASPGAPRAPLLPGTPPRRGALVRPRPSPAAVRTDVMAYVPAHHEPVPAHPDTDRVWREHVAPLWLDYAGVVNRFVAAKGFGSWTAYQGQGARTLVAEMAVAAMVLEAEAASLCARDQVALDDRVMLDAIRAADWLLMHLVDRRQFVGWLGSVEHASG